MFVHRSYLSLFLCVQTERVFELKSERERERERERKKEMMQWSNRKEEIVLFLCSALEHRKDGFVRTTQYLRLIQIWVEPFSSKGLLYLMVVTIPSKDMLAPDCSPIQFRLLRQTGFKHCLRAGYLLLWTCDGMLETFLLLAGVGVHEHWWPQNKTLPT